MVDGDVAEVGTTIHAGWHVNGIHVNIATGYGLHAGALAGPFKRWAHKERIARKSWDATFTNILHAIAGMTTGDRVDHVFEASEHVDSIAECLNLPDDWYLATEYRTREHHVVANAPRPDHTHAVVPETTATRRSEGSAGITRLFADAGVGTGHALELSDYDDGPGF
ncbi:hypothetical protein DFR67_103168 [Williamsia limnetica]|uniref:Uncharacterized protein n=1 Tax=Williamsia limnetica TaxID=882452 RepID=A0A318RT67_WILLI|nr:hypothetical protein [Williamsia limnetica]PYE19257.1 hypothetical protein DFR67_103168 [Williamsia limnetica]